MKRWIAAALLAGLLLAGCAPLERQGVPLWWGLWVDARPAQRPLHETLVPDLAQLKAAGFTNLMILVPLRGNAAGPVLLPGAAARVRYALTVADSMGFNLSLSLTALNQDSLGSYAPSAELRAAWVEGLPRLINELVPDSIHLQWLVVGNSYPALQGLGVNWAALADSCRRLTGARVTYGRPDIEMPTFSYWPELDAVGLHATHAVDGKLKPFARRRHQELSALIDTLQQPVFITEANLIGPQKLAKFKNMLRFWGDGVPLAGICLNTLYSRPAWVDSASYYGMAADEDLKRYLQRYGTTR